MITDEKRSFTPVLPKGDNQEKASSIFSLKKSGNFAVVRTDTVFDNSIRKLSFSLKKSSYNQDRDWQRNIINNIKRALPSVDKLTVLPGEEVSFWRLIGKCKRSRGYHRAPSAGGESISLEVGGGLGDLVTLMHWLNLHTEMTITEVHPFEMEYLRRDEDSVPLGVDLLALYKTKDYQFINRTENTYYFRFWIRDERLCGEVNTENPIDTRIYLEERNERFIKEAEGLFHENELWRIIDKNGRKREELLQKSHVLVLYE